MLKILDVIVRTLNRCITQACTIKSAHHEDKILAEISRVGLGMILYSLKNCMHHVFLDSTPSPASQQAIRALFFC